MLWTSLLLLRVCLFRRQVKFLSRYSSFFCRLADDCLAALLSGPHRRCALDWLAASGGEGGSPAECLLAACLGVPSPARGQILLALVQHCPQARSSFSARLELLLEAQQGAGSAAWGQLAPLLPAAQAALQHGCSPAAGEEARAAAVQAAAGLRGPLLAWVASKPSLPEPDSLAGTMALLRSHALSCLRLCLQLQALSGKERGRLLPPLLPPKGFPLDAANLGAEAGQPALPLSAERAEAALVVLPAQPDAAVLLQYLQTYAATLAKLFK